MLTSGVAVCEDIILTLFGSNCFEGYDFDPFWESLFRRISFLLSSGVIVWEDLPGWLVEMCQVLHAMGASDIVRQHIVILILGTER